MSPIPLNGILFDFDGTLAPNLDLKTMRSEVVALTAQTPVPEQVYEGLYIVEIIAASSAWLANTDPRRAAAYEESAHRLITDFEIQAAQFTEPFAGVPELLVQLRNNQFRLGVVTRNCRAAVLEVFPDLLNYVDALHARDDVKHLKPDTRHLSASLQALNTQPDKSAMVGDGALDMRAGRALNMFCIGVLTGSNDAAALTAAGADQVLDHCLAITEHVVNT